MLTTTYCSLYEAIAWQMFQNEEAINFARNLSFPSGTYLIVWQHANEKRNKPYVSFEQAYDNTVRNLQSGKLTAYGRRNNSSRSEEILVSEWRDLKLSDVRAYPNSAYLVKHGKSYIEFIDVCFLRDEVNALFLSGHQKSKSGTQKKLNAPASVAHREWAKSYYNKMKSEGLRSVREEDERAFRERFSVPPRNVIRNLRKEFVPEWCEPGRRRNNLNIKQ